MFVLTEALMECSNLLGSSPAGWKEGAGGEAESLQTSKPKQRKEIFVVDYQDI